MLTRGHAHMKVSRATWAAYDSVIFTLRSGPGGIARDQFGDGGTRIERSPRQLLRSHFIGLVRYRSAATSYRTEASWVHKSERALRSGPWRPSEPSSTLPVAVAWVRSRGPPNRRRSYAVPASATSGRPTGHSL